MRRAYLELEDTAAHLDTEAEELQLQARRALPGRGRLGVGAMCTNAFCRFSRRGLGYRFLTPEAEEQQLQARCALPGRGRLAVGALHTLRGGSQWIPRNAAQQLPATFQGRKAAWVPRVFAGLQTNMGALLSTAAAGQWG